jgi:hypothetical protein
MQMGLLGVAFHVLRTIARCDLRCALSPGSKAVQQQRSGMMQTRVYIRIIINFKLGLERPRSTV